MSDNKVVAMPQANYRPSGKYAIRWEKLHPGSTFTIHSEMSRGIRHSRDLRVYRKAINGNYAEDIITGKGCILMDKDMVQPVVKDNKQQYTAGDKRPAPRSLTVFAASPDGGKSTVGKKEVGNGEA